MTDPRWQLLQSGGRMVVCSFTYGDGHVCDQRLGIGHAGLPRPPEPDPTAMPPAAAILRDLVEASKPPPGSRPGYEGDVTPPRGWYFTPAVGGIHELHRQGHTPRRPMPEALQPKDEYDQPMWRTHIYGIVPTGMTGKRIMGAAVYLPARVRCPECKQVRSLTTGEQA